MSQENVEIVKKFIPPVGTDYKVLVDDDAVYAAVEAALEPLLTPHFEGAFVAWGQRQSEFRGPAPGLRDGLARLACPLDELLRRAIEEVLAVGDDRVARPRARARIPARHSSRRGSRKRGRALPARRKARRIVFYSKRTEALEAVGLWRKTLTPTPEPCGILRGRCRRRTWITHRAIDAFNRRDIGAFLALHDPDAEFTPSGFGREASRTGDRRCSHRSGRESLAASAGAHARDLGR